MKTKKVYSLEIDKNNAVYLKEFLQLNNINFEPSGCYNNIYFSITCTEDEAEKINNYIDELYALDEMEK
jgi:hypothetical protein